MFGGYFDFLDLLMRLYYVELYILVPIAALIYYAIGNTMVTAKRINLWYTLLFAFFAGQLHLLIGRPIIWSLPIPEGARILVLFPTAALFSLLGAIWGFKITPKRES